MKNIVVWGTGMAYRQFTDRVSVTADFLVDNDSTKWGMNIDGLTVYSPDKLKECIDDTLIIVCSMYYKDIRSQLRHYGFEDNMILNSSDCTEEQIVRASFFNHKKIKSYLESYPIMLIDVGCRDGIPSLWRDIQNHIRVVGFEPDEEEYRALMSGKPENFLYLNTALSNKKTVIDFYVNNNLYTSSVFPIDEAYFRRFSIISDVKNVNIIKVLADTLDNQLSQANIEDVDFIKLDTQGSELQILEGAASTISDSVLGIEVEVEFLPLYREQPLFGDVDKFLQEKGFELFDLGSYNWKREIKPADGLKLKTGIERSRTQIVYADALYFRSIAEVQRILSRTGDIKWKKSKVLRFISICILYNFLDYAIEIANAARAWNILGTEEYKLVIEAL